MQVLIITSYLLFCALSVFIYKTLLFSFVLFFYICIGLFLINFIFHNKQQKKLSTNLFLIVFLIYSLWGFLCRYFLISNPTEQYFLMIDQVWFFNKSIELSFLPTIEMFKEIFSNFHYSELPLNMFLLALKTKIFGTNDLNSLFQLLTLGNAFKGTLICVLILKLLSQFNYFDKTTYKSTLYFAFFSCIFINSVYLLRDIDITLLFVIMAVIVFAPRKIYHYFLLVLLVIATYYMRQENGLFSILFLLTAIYIDGKDNKYLKIFVFISVIVLLFFVAFFVRSSMENTLISYSSLSIIEASNYSFGAIIAKFPKPFNYFLQTAFGQILPFPFYVYSTYPEVFFEWIEWLNPFYWIYIWFTIIIAFFKSNILKKISINILILLIISFLYIFLVSISQTGVRRQMPVYPFIFSISFIIGSFYAKRNKIIILFLSIVIILVLHGIYWILKG